VDDERKLVLCLKTLEQWGFGLIRKELLEKVGQFVRKNHIDTPFKNGTPGKIGSFPLRKDIKMSNLPEKTPLILSSFCPDRSNRVDASTCAPHRPRVQIEI
jgi:hypothetical protein